jgi:hypothetical protein
MGLPHLLVIVPTGTRCSGFRRGSLTLVPTSAALDNTMTPANPRHFLRGAGVPDIRY